MSGAVRPFELRVQNFLNLASAKHYHATHGLEFPHRQNGVAIPHTANGVGAMAYKREYSTGAQQQFSETCRFCRRDGNTTIHYGCWEEEALSFERCVRVGGIYYNSSLPDSNEYGCKQYRSSRHYQRGISTLCGGRPRQ